MIIVSIDIETSGLDSEKNQVLSIGAIIEDTSKKLPYDECPKFNAAILQREITGSPRAITMNKILIEKIGDYIEGNEEKRTKLTEKPFGFNTTPIQFFEEEDVIPAFYKFLHYNGFGDPNEPCVINGNSKPITITVAGKNFGTFDKLFLEQLRWWKKLIRPRSRIVDPAILCCKWNIDNFLPSLGECKDRLGIEGIVTHDALEDAWDVIQILREFY